MPGKTAIEWASHSWNPVTGCTKVSPGCAHCYAETFAERWRGIPGHPYEQGFDLRLWPSRLQQPLSWRQPRMIFVNSMSDLFHEEIPDEFIARVFVVMALADWHVFQVLTKRPERMADVVERIYALGIDGGVLEPAFGPLSAGPLRNVWLGASIENRRFVSRADILREVPATVRFISAEPLLGPLEGLDLSGISWLIAGGESGPGHRPMRMEWVRDLRDAAAGAGAAFFFKQVGGSHPGGELEELPEDLRIREWPQLPATPGSAAAFPTDSSLAGARA